MTETSSTHESRRARKGTGRGHGSSSVKSKAKLPFGSKAVLLSALLVALLIVWGTAKTFLALCVHSCSYVGYSPVAGIAMWVAFALSVACVLAVLYYASESLNRPEKKTKAIIATAIAGLASGFFYSGAFQDILSSAVIRIMY